MGTDLTEIQGTLSTKIIGADATALETNAVNASTQGDLFTRDLLNTSLLSGAVSLTTTPAAVKVGASNLVGRKVVIVIPTNGTIYWGSTSSVTSTTGMPLVSGQRLVLSISDAVTFYAVTASGTVDVRILEGA